MLKKSILPMILFFVLLVSCNDLEALLDERTLTQDFHLTDYQEKTFNLDTVDSSSLRLDDGAAIVLPDYLLGSDIQVTIERNPEKVRNLPPLDNGILQLSDFYDFSISGLNYSVPVTIIIPISNNVSIPNESGIFTIGIPTQYGWEFTPVIPEDGKIRFTTTELGDPLIAWHYADPAFLESISEKKTEIAGNKTEKKVCNPTISLDYNELDDGSIEIYGNLKPVHAKYQSFFGLTPSSEAIANREVTLSINTYDEDGFSRSTTTNEEGEFREVIDAKHFDDGWHWVFASVKCSPWSARIAFESKGYLEFNYVTPGSQSDQNQSTESEPAAGQPAAQDTSPRLSIQQDSMCRTGPSKSYVELTVVTPGYVFPIIGRNGNGWWLVQINSSNSCWVYGNNPQGDYNSVRIVEVQPPILNLPIYDFNTGNMIGYLNCAEAYKYTWMYDVALDEAYGESGCCWVNAASMFNSNRAGFFRSDGINICGWDLP